MNNYEVKFCVTFEVVGTPDTSTLRDALRFGIDKACDEGFLTPDDESSSVVSSSIYHISTLWTSK